MELSTGKILYENLAQPAFHQTLGDEFTFQQDSNLKHTAKSIKFSIKCVYEVLFTSADVTKCYTEIQPKTSNSKRL
jgi:hypothetical protein